MAEAPVRRAVPGMICPGCGVSTVARLAPHEVCAACKSQRAWNQQGERVVIDHAAIDAAVARRAGEAAGEPLWRKAIAWVAPALTLTLALASAFTVWQLVGARELGPLDSLIDGLSFSCKLAVGIGAAALASGIVALVRSRKSRHFRRIAMLASHLLAIAVGATALVFGLLGVAMVGGFSGDHTTMPARDTGSNPPHIQRILDATVVVLASDREGDARNGAVGTGAVIAAGDGHAWIVTCSHVAIPYMSPSAFRHPRDAQPVWIQLSDGREGAATVRWTAPPPLDVVLVDMPIANPPQPVPIAPDAGELSPGAPVTFVPNPYRAGWKVLHGHVLDRESHKTPAGLYDLVHTDLPVQHGDSGSGLFDARGQLVGLNTWARFGAGTSQGISLPSETMRAVIDAVHAGSIDRLVQE
jgi:S1-C subfamily serine protease